MYKYTNVQTVDTQSKNNQTITFDQVIEYKMRIFFFFFFKNYGENEAGRLLPDLLFLGNALYEVKASSKHFSFNIIW